MEAHIEKYMQRAIELAERGKGNVAPNPMVGCVIVKDDKIIAEGWHEVHGGPHAEVVALSKVKEESLLIGADVYVSLEPCSHQGLTPPCAPKLAELPIQNVYVATVDPDPRVSGKGIEILKKAGKNVISGVLEAKARYMNRAFFTFHEQKRPYVVLKWAQTCDGFFARSNNNPSWISNTLSRKIVHKWRGELASILVGNATAQKDDPRLNTRDWCGEDPIRIIIDRKLSLPNDLMIYSDEGKTLTYNLKEDRKSGNKEFVTVQQFQFIKSILEDLYSKGIQSILVEGGAIIHGAFIEDNLWDECRIFQSEQKFGEGIPAPSLPKAVSSTQTLRDNQLFMIKNN